MLDNKVKILIVEDDESIRDILQAFIQQNGYLVVSASDGIDGYNLFVRESPRLVILYIMMPRMNGYDLLKKIKGVIGHSCHPADCFRQGAGAGPWIRLIGG